MRETLDSNLSPEAARHDYLNEIFGLHMYIQAKGMDAFYENIVERAQEKGGKLIRTFAERFGADEAAEQSPELLVALDALAQEVNSLCERREITPEKIVEIMERMKQLCS